MSSEPAAASPRSVRFGVPVQWSRGAIGVVVFLVLAELAGLAIPSSVLPRMSTVLGQAAQLVTNGQFIADVGATLESWVLGLAITVVIAVPLGLLLGSVPGVRFFTRAIVEFLRPIPSVALILLVSLVLGSGMRMTLTLIVYGCMWPILYNTIAGLDDVDPVAKETLRAFGFGRLSIAWRVSLPSALPFIATGLRIASAVALILSIGAGYIIGGLNGPGIGTFIANASTGTSDTPQILAATLWAGILGLVLNAVLTWAERRLLPWHKASL
ncbi:MAG TPA: ABC transporter permease [Trebonia sp.]|nr:ABC transporter permease [Trebonia sp.]